MPIHSGTGILSQFRNSPLSFTSFNPLRSKIPSFPLIQTKFLQMVTQSGSTKRPTCPTCSKPARICLCDRLKTPALHNSVAVTILQHSLEKKHPLNSTRIATLGLNNVNVITVSDVNFQSRFSIRSLDTCCAIAGVKLDENGHLFDEMLKDEKSKILEKLDPIEGADFNSVSRCDSGGMALSCSPVLHEKCETVFASKFVERLLDREEVASGESKATEFNFAIEKYGAIISSNNCLMASSKSSGICFEQLLPSDIAFDNLRRGFVVKKHQRKLLEQSKEYEETEEFELMVPQRSMLLFPSEESVDVDAVNFEVKNLIVLDGTWAKAKRMYNENPWLKLLPHIRLDINKLSLYSEVRHQPRAGYLSTIESIAYALKAVGEDNEGLDGLLEVFESMVGDQRRCKKERLSRGTEFGAVDGE